MHWWHILYYFVVIVLGIVVLYYGAYLLLMLPFMILGLVISILYGILRLFLPFLPEIKEPEKNNRKKKRSTWYGKTEADKHRELVEHIRIQQMNADRNRR